MKNFLNRFFEPKTNCVEIGFLFAQQLDVKISLSSFKKDISEHPNFPSLLCISDVLSHYGIENLSFKLSSDKLTETPVPFIAQIKGENQVVNFFTIVNRIDAKEIQYFNPESNSWKIIALDNFKTLCSDVILIAEPRNDAGEKDYELSIKTEKREALTNNLMTLWLPILVVALGLTKMIGFGSSAILPLSHLILTLAGCVIGFLLVMYELDQHNIILQQICRTSSKVNCGAVLQSRGSKIFGINWSVIGFSYFAGLLMIELIWGVTNRYTLVSVAWLNTLAATYIFYSVYYQWRIIKQWCVLCLMVQSVLLLQVIITFLGRWHFSLTQNILTFEVFLQFFAAFAIPFTVMFYLIPALRKAKERGQIFNELQRLKHNPDVFQSLLEKQPELKVDAQGLGITLGNPNAEYKIIKVCSPYCGPCAKAHLPLENLLHNNPNIQLQIIFSTNMDDIRALPVKHFLAIAESSGEETVKLSLDDWYLAERKDYDVFAKKHPMNGELKKQDSKIAEMAGWCDKVNIAFTPTIFLSTPSADTSTRYYQMPEIYNVSDLKYFLSV